MLVNCKTNKLIVIYFERDKVFSRPFFFSKCVKILLYLEGQHVFCGRTVLYNFLDTCNM